MKLVKFHNKYAIKNRSFFGETKYYDLKHQTYWWGDSVQYYKDCWTEDKKIILKACLKLDLINKDVIKLAIEVMEDIKPTLLYTIDPDWVSLVNDKFMYLENFKKVLAIDLDKLRTRLGKTEKQRKKKK